MPKLELPAGTIEYDDSGPPPGRDDAPVVVLLHGLLMDRTVWREVAPGLAQEARVIAPTLPLGAHRIPMRADADLSLRGMTRLVADFLDALALRDATLVLNDWGGPILLVELGLDARVGRLVLCACEAFDNFPPGLPGRLAALAGKLGQAGVALAMPPLRSRRLRRFPLLFGWMSRRPVPEEIARAWFAPTRSRAIRRDVAKYAGSRIAREETIAATERLRDFDRPALVVWAAEDRLMPRDHGRRLAELLPQGRLVEIEDSYTLVPLDRPDALLAELRMFVTEDAPTTA
jgi:pimeloyl-ACP methyl ester carboxylesterase